MMNKLIAIRFTEREIYELDCLLANGVRDFEDPSNKVAASAYAKIGRARLSQRSEPTDRARPVSDADVEAAMSVWNNPGLANFTTLQRAALEAVEARRAGL